MGKRLYTRVSDVFDRENTPRVALEDSIRKVILEMSGGRLGAVAVTGSEGNCWVLSLMGICGVC